VTGGSHNATIGLNSQQSQGQHSLIHRSHYCSIWCMSTLQPFQNSRFSRCRHSTRDVDDCSIPVITGNRPTAVPPTPHHERRVKCQRVSRTLVPVARSFVVHQRLQRQQTMRPVKGDIARTTPSLYVISSAALSKPHAC